MDGSSCLVACLGEGIILLKAFAKGCDAIPVPRISNRISSGEKLISTLSVFIISSTAVNDVFPRLEGFATRAHCRLC
jgi:hypothetical protein